MISLSVAHERRRRHLQPVQGKQHDGAVQAQEVHGSRDRQGRGHRGRVEQELENGGKLETS